MENFAITGGTIAQFPDLLRSMAAVKQAAAATNRDLGLLSPKTAEAIIEVCKEIRAGGLADQFTVGPVQGGAGTSTNMNANEVIANRALELLGQSTNDVYPTAVRLALVTALRRLCDAQHRLADGAFAVIGNDLTVTMAAEAGQLQLNAFEPVIAYSLHQRAARPRDPRQGPETAGTVPRTGRTMPSSGVLLAGTGGHSQVRPPHLKPGR